MSTKLLSNQYKGILNDQVEGFTVELNNESLYEWKVYIEGPKDTYYEGGVFQLNLTFPKDYPMNPPTLKFISEFWHPNVYQRDGKVCISILHPPGEDILSGELPEERWLPTQSVTSIILSLLSLLGDPNISSPANVDASVEWKNNKEGFKKRCAKLIDKANKAKPTHIKIPHPDTNPEEHKISVEKIKKQIQASKNPSIQGVNMEYFENYSDYGDNDSDNEDNEDYNEDDSTLISNNQTQSKQIDSVTNSIITSSTSIDIKFDKKYQLESRNIEENDNTMNESSISSFTDSIIFNRSNTQSSNNILSPQINIDNPIITISTIEPLNSLNQIDQLSIPNQNSTISNNTLSSNNLVSKRRRLKKKSCLIM